MANWIHLHGMKGFTARCDVRFRRPLPVGCTILLESRVLGRRRGLVQLSARAVRRDDGGLVADCTASFMLAPDPGSPPPEPGGETTEPASR
jgi:acyl dehydratase